jgi:hypothetical protein
MSGSKLVRATILAALAMGLLSSALLNVNQAKEGSKPVLITDDCEPLSFNAVFPGACVGSGKTTFDKFIAQLTQHQNAFLWMFAPVSLLCLSARRSVLGTRAARHTLLRRLQNSVVALLFH